MKFYGYQNDSEAESPDLLKEVTIAANPETLRQIAAFLLHTADLMDRHGDEFGHEHFPSQDRDAPQLVVCLDETEQD